MATRSRNTLESYTSVGDDIIPVVMGLRRIAVFSFVEWLLSGVVVVGGFDPIFKFGLHAHKHQAPGQKTSL